MDKNDIDDLANILMEKNEVKFIKFFNKMNITFEKEKFLDMEYRKDICKQLAVRVEPNKSLIEYIATEYESLLAELTPLFSKDLIKEIIEKYHNIFRKHELVLCIIATEDVEFIKKCVEERKKYKLNSENIVQLIIETKDVEYIKNCVENGEELELKEKDVVSLIIATNDTQYIKTFIMKNRKYKLLSEDITDLILSTNDIEYIKSSIEDYQHLLDASDLIRLIESTKDKEYMKFCLKNKHLLAGQVVYLMEEIGEPDFIKEYLSDNDGKLRFLECEGLVKATHDEEYIKDYLNTLIICDFFPEQTRVILSLLEEINDKQYVENYIEKRLGVSIENSKVELTSLEIPKGMTAGIEIESENYDGYINVFKKLNLYTGKWGVEKDVSLSRGMEVVSPILKNGEDTVSDIYKICTLLEKCENDVSENCGGHVHIGADYLKNIDAYRNLLEIYGNNEKAIYLICNEAGKLPRFRIDEYATPISGKMESVLEEGEIDLRDESDIDTFISDLYEVQGDRYSGINFGNLYFNTKNTVEFRLANGTLDPNLWIENINLFGGIVNLAQDISEIHKKQDIQLTDEELRKLNLFEKLKSDDISEEQKLEILLELVIKENRRENYMYRYKINSVLLEKNNDKQEDIESQVAKKSIILSKKKIGKHVLTGEEAITAPEYNLITSVIGRNMQNIIEQNQEQRG